MTSFVTDGAVPAHELPSFAFGIAQEIGGRSYQEDAFVAVVDFNALLSADTKLDLTIPRSFFAIYDGHGGRGCVSFVEERLHLELVNALENSNSEEEALMQAFAVTEEKWLSRATKHDSWDPSGTTANVCFIVANKLFCANAGDTRAVLYRKKKSGGGVMPLSEDHKPTKASELERIQGVGGHVKAKTRQQKSWFRKTKTVQRGPQRCYPGGLAVARSFGDIRCKIEEFGGLSGVVIAQPDVTCTDLSDDTKMIVIGSDGLWDNVVDYSTLHSDLSRAFRLSHQKLSVASAAEAQTEGVRRNDFCATTMAHAAVRHSLDEISRSAADNTTALVVLFPEAFSTPKYPNLDRGLTRGASMRSLTSSPSFSNFDIEELLPARRLSSVKAARRGESFSSDSEDESVALVDEHNELEL